MKTEHSIHDFLSSDRLGDVFLTAAGANQAAGSLFWECPAAVMVWSELFCKQ